MVSSLAVAACEAVSDKAAVAAADGRKGGWVSKVAWDPLRNLLRSASETLSSTQKACLRCLVTNSVWSRERLFRANRACSPCCLRCGSLNGSLWHLRFQCPGTALHRLSWIDPVLERCAARVQLVSPVVAEAFSRAVLPDPRALVLERPFVDTGTVRWINQPECGFLSGRIFADGSTLFPAVPALRSAGWALVQVDEAGNFEAACYGDVPLAESPSQIPRDAEDYAALMLSHFALAPYTVWFDCAGTLSAIWRGKAVQQDGPREHLWSRFFAALSEEEFVAKKTKAHTTEADVAAGITTAFERKGNSFADTLARKGAEISQQPASNRRRYLAVASLHRRLAIFTAKMQEAGSKQDKALSLEAAASPWLSDGPVFQQQPEDEDVEESEVAATTCPPCKLDSNGVAAFALHGHSVVAAEVGDAGGRALLFCSSCGAFSERRSRALAFQCRGRSAPGLWIQRAQLSKRRFPQSGSTLQIGEPKTPTLDQQNFLLELTSAQAEPATPALAGWLETGVSHVLPAPELLAAYGLNLEDLQREVASIEEKEKRRGGQPAWWQEEPDDDL